MKKTLLIYLLILICGFRLSAREFTHDGIIYTVLDEKALTVETKAGYTKEVNDKTEYIPGNKTESILWIPATVSDGEKEYTVTRLGDYAFCQNSDLLLAVIPDTVEEIGDYAFSICISLYGLTLPKSGVTFGDYTFFGCLSLSSVELPKDLSEISAGMFGVCMALENINIPSTVTSIGTGAFMGSGVKDLTLPENVFTIGSLAFSTSSIQTITLPSNLIMIGMQTFEGCKKLQKIYYNMGLSSPAVIFNNTFSEEIFHNATLYVPYGKKEIINESSEWKNFEKVEEMEFAGIENISEDNNVTPEYFDVNGVRILSPKSGQIVIRRIGNKAEKIIM